jgi:hypothetical protein
VCYAHPKYSTKTHQYTSQIFWTMTTARLNLTIRWNNQWQWSRTDRQTYWCYCTSTSPQSTTNTSQHRKRKTVTVMISSLFWDVTYRMFLLLYLRFDTLHRFRNIGYPTKSVTSHNGNVLGLVTHNLLTRVRAHLLLHKINRASISHAFV